MKPFTLIFLLCISFAGGIVGTLINEWLGVESYIGILGVFAAAQAGMALLACCFRKLVLRKSFFPNMD
ncbi:MAG: hypothetical protein JST06_09120 [Bacteroidetes bacterium]|nr:hypothetical protein [Bacteroidota bacterium]MBS1629857.1 hypothetical protein [Bacteroidota bacterium]